MRKDDLVHTDIAPYLATHPEVAIDLTLAGEDSGVQGDPIVTLNDLFVAPEARGKGLGSGLLKLLCESADKHRAILGLQVGTRETSRTYDLIAWYKTYGFTGTGHTLTRMPADPTPQTLTRITIRLSDEGGNSASKSFLARTKAEVVPIMAAAAALGLPADARCEIPFGTALYSGRYSREGDESFTLRTEKELSAFLSEAALAALRIDGFYEFDGDRVSALISLAGTIDEAGEFAEAA